MRSGSSKSLSIDRRSNRFGRATFNAFQSFLRKMLLSSYLERCKCIANYKKDDKSLPSNYRPIFLLSSIGKTMERCVHKHLYNYVIDNDLITPLQSRFKHGDSTNFQLIHTYHSFCEAVDSGKEVKAVFCDISKAFDRVWHRGLLYKLSCIGCSNPVVKWFSSYLSGRRQRVVINGESSDLSPFRAGVPQGSILGPLLFLIYINHQDQDQDSLLVKRRNDNHSPGPVIRELVPSSHQRSELSNTILCIFSG